MTPECWVSLGYRRRDGAVFLLAIGRDRREVERNGGVRAATYPEAVGTSSTCSVDVLRPAEETGEALRDWLTELGLPRTEVDRAVRAVGRCMAETMAEKNHGEGA